MYELFILFTFGRNWFHAHKEALGSGSTIVALGLNLLNTLVGQWSYYRPISSYVMTSGKTRLLEEQTVFS